MEMLQKQLSDHVLTDALERRSGMLLKTMYYVVEQIDGDYAHLRRTDEEMEETELVARALLPDAIREGTRLKYEMLQYEIIE